MIDSKRTTERPMRRQDRLLSESDCRMVLARVEHAVLATVDPSGAAYGVPVTPVEADGVFYFHGAAVGRKADNLAANPSASLTWIAMGTVLPEAYSVDFVSVIASGKVVRVEDPDEKKKALRAICARFAPHPIEAVDAYIEGNGNEAGVWKLVPEKISGKARRRELLKAFER